MADGFKVGEAFIDVDADATAAVAKLRRQFAQAKGPLSRTADEIGDEFGRRLGSRIEKHLKATKGRMVSIGSDIGSTTGSRIVSTMDKQLRGAKGRLSQTAEGLGSTIAAKVSTSLSQGLNTKLDSTLAGKAKQVGRQVGAALGESVDTEGSVSIARGGKIKTALDSVAERAQAQFQGMVFAGAFAGMPAAAAVAAAGTVAALSIVPIALAAGAAKLQAGNEDVARSYQQLGATATASMTRASSVLSGELVKGTDRLTQGMLRLEPAITGAFALAAPAIDGVVDSVITFSDEALPGMITGLTKTNDAMRGTEALAKGAGRGVSDFLANMSTGSASAATNATTLGRAIQDLLAFAGQLIANISNGGTTVLPMFANALSGIYGIVLNLASGGFSPLMAAAGGFITVVSGAVGVVGALTGTLGGLVSPLAAVAGGLLAVNLMTRGALVSTLAAQFVGLGTSIGAASGAGGKFKATMSGLAAGVFSPAGIAVMGLVVGLGLLGAAQQRAAQAAADHRTRVADLGAALRESKGAIDDNVRATAAKALGDMKAGEGGKSVLQTARELGLSMPMVTDAYLGNAAAATALNGKLNDLKVNGTEPMTGEMSNAAMAADDMQRALHDNRGEVSAAVQNNKDLAAATAASSASMRNITPATAAAAQASSELRAAWATMYSPLASVTDKASALIMILDRLNGRVPSYEEAIQSSNDTLRSMADSLGSAGFAANGFGKELLNSDGTVSTWTKNGSDLQNNLVTLQSGFANAGASIHGMVASGMSYNDAAQQVNSTLTTQRAKFVELAQGMGLSGDEANRLADKYGLIPSEVVTKITDYGSAVSSAKDVDTLTGKLKSLPPDTPVRVTSITAEAEAKLVDLGYTVTHMPDGTVVIFSNTGNAESGIGRVQGGLNALQDKTVTVTYRTVYTTSGVPVAPRGEAQAAFNATGGYQFPASRVGGYAARHRETGGTLPALAGMAGASWTGERGPELSFPTQTSYIATNQQSMRIERRAKAGEVALERNVTVDSPDPAVAPPIQLTINVYPSPEMDVDAFVDKVARKTQRLLNGGS